MGFEKVGQKKTPDLTKNPEFILCLKQSFLINFSRYNFQKLYCSCRS